MQQIRNKQRLRAEPRVSTRSEMSASAQGADMRWQGRLFDLLATLTELLLLWLVVALAVRPIRAAFAAPGLLIYSLFLLAASMLFLQQAVTLHHAGATRALYGIAGGFLAWSVIEVSGDLGVPVLPSMAGVVLFLMVALIIGLLWRHVLPSGVRFFGLTLLLNWFQTILMIGQERLAHYSPVFTLSYRATGVLTFGAALMLLVWVLFRAQQRIQRVWGTLLVWFLVSFSLYVFRGTLF